MRTRVTGVLACVLLVAGFSAAQEPPQEPQPQVMQQMMQRMQQMIEARRQQMMGERNALLEQLRASGGRLDELVRSMNASQGDAKTEAVAAVVSELVSQHNDLLDLIESQPGMMQQMQMMMMDMMQRMMQQMQMGAEQEETEP